MKKEKKVNIALISPNMAAISETFIAAHKSYLDGNIEFYYGGSLPTHHETEGYLDSTFFRIINAIKRKVGISKWSSGEQALKRSFLRKKIDIVFAEYGPSGVACLKVCKKINIPLITIFLGFDASIKYVLMEHKTSYKELFLYSSYIIVVSKVMKDKLLNLGCQESKIIVTPCAPNDKFMKIKPLFSKMQFIGIGRFVDKKAPYYTILAFSRVLKKYPKANLVLAGDGKLFNVCKNLVKYLELEKNINFPGLISPSEFQNYLKESLAFVQHSITAEDGDMEGTPVSLLEASAAGLPVISTYHAGIPDVVKHKESGFLSQEHDVDSMSKYMISLLDDIALAKKMGLCGKNHIKNNYSMSHHIAILNNAIKSSLKK